MIKLNRHAAGPRTPGGGKAKFLPTTGVRGPDGAGDLKVLLVGAYL
jgi:hypothetical protein